MLCKVCVGMLRGGIGEIWAGTHDLMFEHHKTTITLRRSREDGCSICTALSNVLLHTNLLEDRPISIQASLRKLPSKMKGYSLDFRLEKKFSRIFLLKETPDPADPELRTPRSHDTSSDEVFELAQRWMKRCKCVESQGEESSERWYPKRLLNLKDIRSANGLEELDGSFYLSDHSDLTRKKVYLVDAETALSQGTKTEGTINEGTRKEGHDNFRYVTLSHCWGKPKSVQSQLRLTTSTEERFKKEGIELKDLPKTFRDAILFACRIEKVGFMWIDSLCIKQPTGDENHYLGDQINNQSGESGNDWLEQSRDMYRIYERSFLNISATAAVDGDQGLFSKRKPEYLWEDEINVHYTGTDIFGSTRSETSKSSQLTRCTVIDVSFWDDLVEKAPVNQRGWVLQERIMAPRVLHFCRDQIAWECAEFDNAEGHPERELSKRARLGVIVDDERLKNLTSAAGFALRSNRLRGFPDPDKDMPDLDVYEHWKRIVEIYSRMKLTVSHDKLIALSGIAKLIDSKFVQRNEYIAGLWRNNLESQLLWQVNELHRDGIFENPARRDPTRAPSFSWASIDTPHGVTYHDVTDYGMSRYAKLPQKMNREETENLGSAKVISPNAGKGEVVHADSRQFNEESGPSRAPLPKVEHHHIVQTDTNSNAGDPEALQAPLIKVEKYYINHEDSQNKFGMVKEGKLLIRPRHLRRIELRRLSPPWRVPHSWRLHDPSTPDKPLDHFNLYLDAPDSDVDIFKATSKLFCMPVAYGERTVREGSRYLYCLLLKEEDKASFGTTVDSTGEEYRTFRRIGITKLSNHADGKGRKALLKEETNEQICLC